MAAALRRRPTPCDGRPLLREVRVGRAGMGKCLLFAIALVLVACAEPREPADTMFAGGRIYTVTSASDPEALIVTGERIVAVGKREDLLKRFEPKATVDLTGHFMLPGFVDAHVHPIHGGMNLGQC